MSVELEWRFDEETPDEPGGEERGPGRSPWCLWLGLVGMALLLAVAGLYAWWRVRSKALIPVEAEVQAVAQLELRALAEGDTALYLSLQDDADSTWKRIQEVRAGDNDFLPPPLPGLTATAVLSVEKARVIGDVARVEVVRMAGLPGGEVAPFRALRFYRRSADGRWLHTRADPDYAGHIVIWVGERAKIKSFATDAEWMESVVPRLEGLAGRFCDLVSCRRGDPLVLDFTGTLDHVVESGLPAPFLVGVPDDDKARAVWEVGLQEFLLDRLIVREVGRSFSSDQDRPMPPGGGLFRARLREWLRAKLGLRGPLSPNLDLIGEALDANGWIPLEALWSFPSPGDASLTEIPWCFAPGGDFRPPDEEMVEHQRELAEAEIDLLLVFIEEEYGTSGVVNLLKATATPEVYWMEGLIENVLGDDWATLKSRFAAHVREVTERPVKPPDEMPSFAGYDLVVTCEGPGHLWGLRLDRPEMTLLYPAAGFTFHSWSPDGTWLLAWRGTIYGGGFYLMAADGSGMRRLSSVPTDALPVGWSPDSTHIAYARPGWFTGGLVDVMADESTMLDGHPFLWSPDGSQMVYTGEALYIWLAEGDGSNPRQVAVGSPVAWSPDGTRIAFFTPIKSALKTYEVTTGETTTLLDSSTLHDLLGLEFGRGFVYASALLWSPTGEWIGFGADQLDETETADWMEPVRGGIALVRPDGSDPRVLLTRDASVALADWSPDGRWLTAHIYTGEQFTTTVIGIDGESLLEINGWGAWSPDGRYLAVTERGRLRILEVESGSWYSFEPDARCGLAIWNPRGPLHEPRSSPGD